ncbi:alpha-D-ribose 1-methylphosphonate 5-phosphate C-P lyase [Dethiosulfatibacter aminovorans DSM 17477]|uniref:Alpha-D-ribose 1-methylphosphonate 5-phosphate C-P lyase n=1 Tax=Dethiosulfatibacter aminovorans DSM 17477 TaxID=1121476 RepID=A0A1M6AZC0_9FIRM|nr:alpha-D-ribose 1-methylphosphonate 5-phosphate C-P-lyase PhnJ [Dethiosulfatibacter aminovorans]SHI41573.1 alpha-D-ribose 1-methylphosphonate 5-phosphate C-P lyase [Dethiosulfatibacter aminovorans DSM 17477]
MNNQYNFAFFDEGSKREIRRATLKAIGIPGYQVPFASREMPIGRGWGTGGLQLSLSLVTTEDVIKVIDQGTDESVNAVSIKKLIQGTTGIDETVNTHEATLIQSRHRIPEYPLKEGQIVVLQVPIPEPLRNVEPSEYVTKRLHADGDYSGAWMELFEKIVKYGRLATIAAHPVMVEERYVMTPSPIPKYDNPRLDGCEALLLFGAGREKKIQAIPPYSKVVSLGFEDYPFELEDFTGKRCCQCGATDVYLDEFEDEETGEKYYQCNDTSYCLDRMNKKEVS